MNVPIVIRCSAIGVALHLALGALMHPGGLDSQGGHMNRKTGEYHYHRGSPSAGAAQPIRNLDPPIKEPRSVRDEPRTTVTLSPRTTSRSQPPRLDVVLPSEGPASLDDSELRYEVIKRQISSGNNIVRVMLYPVRSKSPAETDVERVAKKVGEDKRYAAYFYLPGMKASLPAWSIVIVDGDKIAKHTKHDERLPSAFSD